MEKAWHAKRPLPVQRLENNRYIMEFESEHMYNYVLNGGPWRHKGDALIVVSYDGFCRPSEVVIDAVNVWVRFYDVPFNLMAPAFSAVLARKVSPRVLDSEGPVRNKNFLRARVALVLDEPLKPMVEAKIKDKGVMSFEVGYENVPFFCFICGRMGHSKRDCPEEEDDTDEEDHEEDEGTKGTKKLGEWMRKSPLKRSSGKQITGVAAHLAVNRALNFSGAQLEKVRAASSATNSNGGKRKLLDVERTLSLQRGGGSDGSPLKLPWGVSNELSTSVQNMVVDDASKAKKGEDVRDRVSGLDSYGGSSDRSWSVDDLIKGRAVEIPVRSIQERLREAKAKMGSEKKGTAKGSSPIKDIMKLSKKRPLRDALPENGRLQKGGVGVGLAEQEGKETAAGDAPPTAGELQQVGGARREFDIEKRESNSKLSAEKLGNLTGAHDESLQGQ
ncbi:unnamed protein product [Urochloa decumbens]|uniref:CCHC-type domain-containing protein n=1 Tax=Urochloa decumbens TaxID=240449 RepID=A0ABC9B7Z6_9POAL